MRNLNVNEINDLIPYDGPQDHPEPGERWVEATVAELAGANVFFACTDSGYVQPGVFTVLAGKKYHARKVRCCIRQETVNGKVIDMVSGGAIAIKIQTENTAEKIEKLSGLRFDGPADPGTTLAGFMMFEDE